MFNGDVPSNKYTGWADMLEITLLYHTLLLTAIGNVRHLSFHVLPISREYVPSPPLLIVCCCIGASLSLLLFEALSAAKKLRSYDISWLYGVSLNRPLRLQCRGSRHYEQIGLAGLVGRSSSKPVRTYKYVLTVHPNGPNIRRPGPLQFMWHVSQGKWGPSARRPTEQTGRPIRSTKY